MTPNHAIPGAVIGHGIDLVEIARLARSLDRYGDRFVERVFTEGERAYADSTPARRDERYAARFAAKEAAFKALGTGWRSGIAWTDAEVVRLPSGAPELRLSGRAEELALEMGVGRWLLSLSHTSTHAMASVIAVSAGGQA